MSILWRKVTDDRQLRTDRIYMHRGEEIYRATLIREWWSQIKYRIWLLRGKDKP